MKNIPVWPIPGTAALDADPPEFLTKLQTARMLGVSPRTIEHLMRDGRIPYTKITSKAVRFPRAEVLAHVRENLTIRARVSGEK